MLLSIGTWVTIGRLGDPFVGDVGLVVGEPSPGSRTVRLVDSDGMAIEHVFLVTDLRAAWECLACEASLASDVLLCTSCSRTLAAA